MSDSKCPRCGNEGHLKGGMSLGYGGRSFSQTFCPDDLRLLPRLFEHGVMVQQPFHACTFCGLVWSEVSVDDLSALRKTDGRTQP